MQTQILKSIEKTIKSIECSVDMLKPENVFLHALMLIFCNNL